MSIKKVEAYETSDGRIFKCKQIAKEQEEYLEVEKNEKEYYHFDIEAEFKISCKDFVEFAVETDKGKEEALKIAKEIFKEEIDHFSWDIYDIKITSIK